MEERFSDAWSLSMKAFFKKYLLLLGTFLSSFIIATLLAWTLIGMLLIPALLAGSGRIYLKVFRGQKVNFVSDLFSCFPRWWTLLAVTFVKWLCISIGLILFIAPGVYLIARWSFVFPLVFDRGCTFKEAFSKSSEMTQGRFWEVFVMWFLSDLLHFALTFASLGYILLGVYPFLVQFNYYDSFSREIENIKVEVC